MVISAARSVKQNFLVAQDLDLDLAAFCSDKKRVPLRASSLPFEFRVVFPRAQPRFVPQLNWNMEFSISSPRISRSRTCPVVRKLSGSTYVVNCKNVDDGTKSDDVVNCKNVGRRNKTGGQIQTPSLVILISIRIEDEAL